MRLAIFFNYFSNVVFLPSQPLFEFDLLCLFICLPTSLPPYFAFVFGPLIPVINLVCLVIDQYHSYLYYLVLAALIRLKQIISRTDVSRYSKKQRLTLLVPLVEQRGGQPTCQRRQLITRSTIDIRSYKQAHLDKFCLNRLVTPNISFPKTGVQR